jgi:hypothetical protein
MRKLLFVLALSALTFLFPAHPEAVPLPEGPAAGAERVETQDGIALLVTYSGRGSRSEARHHFVEIHGVLVPDFFSRLKYKNYAFQFVSRNYLWGDDGYVRTEEFSLSESASPVTEEQLKKGWYQGTERLAGTPEDWVWGEWNGGALFAAPEKLREAATELNLTQLQRDGSLFPALLRPQPAEKDPGETGETSPEDVLKALEETLNEKK